MRVQLSIFQEVSICWTMTISECQRKSPPAGGWPGSSFHTPFSRTLMSRIWQIGMGQKFYCLPQLMVVIHHFTPEGDKAKWISPHPPREQATRFLLVSSATQMEKSDPLGWIGSLLTDSLILALLQPLHAEADLSQAPCLGYSIARAGPGEQLLRHQYISSQHFWPERVEGF